MKLDSSSIFTALILSFILFSAKFFYEKAKPFFLKLKDLLNNSEEIRALQESFAIMDCQIEAMLYLSPSPMFMTDMEGNMFFGNPAWLKVVGGENIEDFYGHQWASAIDPASRDEVERQAETLRKHPGTFYGPINLRKVNSDTIIRTICRSVIIKGKDGKHKHRLGILYIVI